MKTNKRHPLRKIIIPLLLFTLLANLTTLGNFEVAKAASEFQMKTGYYYGNGLTLSISGVGFKPELLLIKSDTAAGQLVWKSSAMPDAVVSYLGVATADNTDGEIRLDDDGFTVNPALEVNTVNVRYTYIAFAGSDCTSADSGLCVGKYTGTYTAAATMQSISNVGFRPDLVWVKRTTAVVGSFTTSTLAAVNPLYAGYFSATAYDVAGTGTYFRSLDANGFTVGTVNNALGAVYYYAAFKNTAGKLIEGAFTGSGVDNRNIRGTALNGTDGTPIEFEPDFVFVKQNAAVGPAINTTECWGDNSLAVIAGAAALNHIQSLDDNGFQVGNSTAVNAGGILSYWFAFGGAPDPAPTESFFMEKGKYVGDGTGTHIIPVSFAPDLVFIKADDSAQLAVWSLRRDNNLTHYFASATVAFANGIISMGDNDFTIGNHATVNTNLINYEYVAFGNATSPMSGAHAADFVIGSYTGNGLTPTTTPRVIDHLGVVPDFVLVKAPVVAAASNINYWKTSSMTGANETAYLTGTANDTGGTLIRSLDSTNGGGFTMGSNAAVNTAGVNYNFFAFKEGNGIFDVGTYNGTGVAKNITGLGFDPDYVWIKRNTATEAVHRSTSAGISGANSQYFSGTVNAVNMLTGFVEDGFSVGTAATVNTSTAPPAYHYVAWNATTSVNPPDLPVNSTPANLATGVDLNPTLIASAYHDLDGDPHLNTQWQVDDDANFSSPIWTRTAGAAEETSSVTAGNGTFANEYAGRTELDHNSNYYWRVTYFDGVWSSWSTGTIFTTNVLSTPTNSTPANAFTVTTLTPTLTASVFTDGQGTHSAAGAQWQINTSSNFTAPLYDSETFAAGNVFAVPSAILADRGTYYWRVRYLDSGGQWSAYSTPTRFIVFESKVTVSPLFGSTVVDQGDRINIDVQIKLTSGAVINDATVTIDVYDPSGTKIVGPSAMSYLTDSNGIYRYAGYKIPDVSGSYLYAVTAVSNSVTGYGAANFEVRTIAADIKDIQDTLSALQISIGTILSEIGTGDIAAIKAGTDTIDWSDITGIVTDTGDIKSKTDTINWNNVTDIKTKTDTIDWDDVNGIVLKTDTIDWGDITDIKANVATLITEIGTGNIAAIKAGTDTIDWDDITGIVTETGDIKAKTDTIDWANVTAIKTKTDTISWADVTGIKAKTDTIDWLDIEDIQSTLSDLQISIGTILSEIGTGDIAAIKAGTDTIDWGDITGIVTDTGDIKAKTDTINWSNVTDIKTKTDTIDWDDVTGIMLKTDTIDWGDITDIKSDVATLITEIGTGNIAAIKAGTDTIDWGDITGIVSDTGDIKSKTATIDWANVTSILTKTDTIDWDDVTGIKVKTDTIDWLDIEDIQGTLAALQISIGTIITEIGTGDIAAIKAGTDTIDWDDVTGIVTDTGEIKSKTDTINWTNVTDIKTNTDTIDWDDVTGIMLKTDTIDWGDISDIKTNVATLIGEIGTGNIAAIKAGTDTIDWSDITGIVTDTGEIKAKTDTINWSNVTDIKTSTDTIDWDDVTGIKVKTDTIDWLDIEDIQGTLAALQISIGTILSEIGTGNIAAIKAGTDTIDWADVTGIVTATGEVKAKTDNIDWDDVTSIITKTDTINWADVTGIKIKTDTITWDDITDIKFDVATLIGEIGTGNITAIKTNTDTIDWADITGIVSNIVEVKAKTDTINWSNVTDIKTKTDTIDWTDITDIEVKIDTIDLGGLTDLTEDMATLLSEIGTGNIAAIKAGTDTIDWSDITGLVTNTGEVKAKTDTINWANVTDIKTKTDTIDWSDITGIQVSIDELDLSGGGSTDLTEVTDDLAILISEIGTGNISAIKAGTDTIAWSDITGIVSNIVEVKAKTDTINWNNVTDIKTKTDTIDWAQVTGIKVKTDTIDWLEIEDLRIQVAEIQDGVDVLIGAMIVTQAEVSGATSSATSFVTTLTNTTDNFYKNTVLTFNTGDLNGQSRRVAGYNAATKTITLDPALTFAPIAGDAFTIVKQNVSIEEQVAENEATQAAFRAASVARLARIESKVDTIVDELDTVDENLDSIQSDLDELRDVEPVDVTDPLAADFDELSQDLKDQIDAARDDLDSNSVKLTRTLELLELLDPTTQKLLEVNSDNTDSLIALQNKVADLQAISAASRRIIEQKTLDPIIETYMKFNSVEIHFLISNPDERPQTVKFKAFLPEEAKPEHIMDSDGLRVDYDANAGAYFVSGDIALGAKESVTRKVEMQDIWIFAPEEIKSIKNQLSDLVPPLGSTQYAAQGAILKSDIETNLEIVSSQQQNSYASPQDHIVAYRENKTRMQGVKNNLEKLKELVVESGVSGAMVGQVGGIQTFATWGIILVIIFGFGLLLALIFAMWRHQTSLLTAVIGNKITGLPQSLGLTGTDEFARRALPKHKKLSSRLKNALHSLKQTICKPCKLKFALRYLALLLLMSSIFGYVGYRSYYSESSLLNGTNSEQETVQLESELPETENIAPPEVAVPEESETFEVDAIVETDSSAEAEVATQSVAEVVPDESTLDSDSDGITDSEEVILGQDGYITDPQAADSDYDGYDDLTEIRSFYVPVHDSFQSLFTDITATHPFYKYVEIDTHYNALAGYPDGSFRPKNQITRAEALKMLIDGLSIEKNTCVVAPFNDLPAEHWITAYACTAYTRGIVSGSANLLRPWVSITRAEFVKMLVIAKQLPLTSAQSAFSDTNTTEFDTYVNTAYQAGLISGYSAESFGPWQNILREEAAKVIAKTLRLDQDNGQA